MNRNNFLSGLLRTTLAAGALAVSAAPVFADDDKDGKKEKGEKNEKKVIANKAANAAQKRRAANGTIKSVGGAGSAAGGAGSAAGSFVLTIKQGDKQMDLIVTTDAQTTYRVPEVQNATLAALKADMRVVVTGERPNDTTLLARRVQVLKAKKDDKNEKKDRLVTTGVASGVSNTALTVTPAAPAGSAAVTFVLNAETEYSLTGVIGLANGQTVRVASRKDAAGSANVARQVRVPAKA